MPSRRRDLRDVRSVGSPSSKREGPGARARRRGHRLLLAQRSEPQQEFAWDAERLPARRQHAEIGTREEKALDEVRSGCENVLAVVDQEEGTLAASSLAIFPAASPPPSGISPRACAAASVTPAGSATAARSQNHAPPGCRGAESAASRIARRVLPDPPDPVIVSRRASVRSSVASASPLARPTSSSAGREGCPAPVRRTQLEDYAAPRRSPLRKSDATNTPTLRTLFVSCD